MKLFFPIFASLVLQSQVNTEYFGLRKCLMGLGKCKDHCTEGEKEVEKCKKETCCLGPNVLQILKYFIQLEVLRVFEEGPGGLLKNYNISNAIIPKKHQILSILPKIRSFSSSTSANTVIITNATPLNSTTNSTATSTNSDITKSRDFAIASLPPP